MCSSVLIYGASGTVGTYAIQLAKHFEAKITGVTSTPNLELVKYLGVNYVIYYKKEKFVTVSKGVASEKLTDLIFLRDLVGSNKLKPVIDKVFTLETITKAYEYVDTGHKVGNVVINIRE